MSKNSLFAVLLRSPWWYSVLIGIAFIAISSIIVGGQYLALGVFGSLPFFGIAISAAYKQSQQPSQKRIVEVAQEARNLTAIQVANKIANKYAEERYKYEAFKGNGAELTITRGNRTILLSSKRFKAANTGIEPLKELVAAGEKVDATGYLYVALGDISSAATDYAKQNDIEIVQAVRLAELFDGKTTIG